jgi:hypothetical protein
MATVAISGPKKCPDGIKRLAQTKCLAAKLLRRHVSYHGITRHSTDSLADTVGEAGKNTALTLSASENSGLTAAARP